MVMLTGPDEEIRPDVRQPVRILKDDERGAVLGLVQVVVLEDCLDDQSLLLFVEVSHEKTVVEIAGDLIDIEIGIDAIGVVADRGDPCQPSGVGILGDEDRVAGDHEGMSEVVSSAELALADVSESDIFHQARIALLVELPRRLLCVRCQLGLLSGGL